MLPSFLNQTVTRIRPGTKIERGQSVPDWNNCTSLVINKCSMQPASTSLSMDGRVLGIQDSYTCFMYPDADVMEGDRIQFDNKIYTIDGDIRKWASATGRLDHIELRLIRWKG